MGEGPYFGLWIFLNMLPVVYDDVKKGLNAMLFVCMLLIAL